MKTKLFFRYIFVILLTYSCNTFSQTTIDSEDFESGWGIWNDGGIECVLTNSGTPNGTWSVDLEDNSGTDSSMTTDDIDITPYTSIDFTFDFEAISFESGEDFWVQYSDDGGSTFNTISSYTVVIDFNNNTAYTETISIDTGSYTFSVNSQFRIRCDASGGGDDVYIDNILIEGYALTTQEIDITGNGNSILNSSTAISTTDDTDFGNTTVGAPVSHTFTIQNTGVLPLNLTGSPLVSISGDPSFSITTQPSASTIAVGNNLTFIVQYNPSTTGINTATISIANDDSDENPYTFDVQGSNLMLPANGSWSYLDDGSDQGTAWYGVAFNYSGWATGNAELGYGDGDEVTVVNDGRTNDANSRTTYFRKSFVVTAADVANSTLVMNAIRDDGMVVYIDGIQQWSNGMPGVFNYATDASSTIAGADESTWITNAIVNPFLTPGTYEIGVEIHQVSGTSSDTSFNFEMYTNNDYVFVPPPAPDVDTDGVDDYIDSDDDNDGVPDIVEGCYTANLEGLNSTGNTSNEEDITAIISGSTLTMDDGNVINFTTTGTFNQITSYFAGEHGWAIRTHGDNTLGTLELDFTSDITGLFFKLVDFDENETYTVDVYDDTNTLIDLTLSNNIYHLGSYITQTGNTFNDQYFGTNTNNNGDAVASDTYGSVYFYFPTTQVSRILFSIDQPDGSTIRIAAMHFCGLDTDSDGVDDYYDSDSDNDGIPDLVEAGGTDTDGDGIIDNLTDTDIDGLADTYDITPNVYFAEEVTTLADLDFDGDGFKNRIDLDSDNDGIVDIIEAGGIDTDGDAKLDAFVDGDSDGYHDSFDGVTGILITGADTDSDGIPNSYPNDDADATGFPNFLDIDSDDDGITDNTEAQATGSYISHANSDTDSGGFVDGIDDSYDNDNINFGGNGLIPIDTDFDGTPDYLDTNSDDGEEDDSIEGHDTDDDGIADSGSTADTGIFVGTDSDNDGLDDGYDNNDGGFDSTNGSLTAASHPIVDGGTDRDWRYTIIYLDFDGVNDHIDFGDEHRIAGSYSFESWILQEATPTLTYGAIISKRDVNAGNLRGYHMAIGTDDRPNVMWYDNSGVQVLNITSPYAITNNRWYHLAFVYNGTDAIMYIDGIEVVRATPSGMPSTGTEKSIIGAMYDSSTPALPKYFFNGSIDEVRFWKMALSEAQLQQMMNQEIQQNGSAVSGLAVPTDITGGLQWADSDGYYNMNADNAVDMSSNTYNGVPRNTTTLMLQNAPLPYTTIRDGDWEDTTAATPWTYGDSVWDAPNSVGVDGVTKIDWNIVSTSHNVTADTDVKLHGLISNSTFTSISNESITDSKLTMGADGNSYELNISGYLKLDGKIDLENESQLVQGNGSLLDVDSSGYIERDQQGVENAFTYNYWSSPVAKRSTTTNNLSFNVTDVLRDGTDALNPITIDFDVTNSDYYYADGALTTPRKIATAWIWKFVNLGNAYANWEFVGGSNNLNVADGYTMKGTSGLGAISANQNYVFRGKPNNVLNGATELVHTTFGVPSGDPYITLTGNPFPSAIDANAFINDNATSTTQTIYFWEHWGGGTHNLGEYQGGYSTYTKAGSTPTPTLASSHPDVDQTGSGGILPGQYIPVGQGFFVVSSAMGGDVVFKNSQRTFEIEGGNPNSNFSRSTPIEKIRLGFDSPDHFHRQLLVTFISEATDAIDIGYDALGFGTLANDSFFIQEDKRFVIQAFESFDVEREIPIVVIIDEDEDGMIQKFMIDSLENISSDKNIFLKDSDTNIIHDLRQSNYEVALPTGEHKTRFSLVFRNQALDVDDELLPENSITIFMNNPTSEIVIRNTGSTVINNTTLYNALGQTISTWTHKSLQQEINLPINDLSTGVYIVQIETENGNLSQKIIIE